MNFFLKFTFSLAFFLSGCSDGSSQGKVDAPKPTKLQGVISEHQLKALEKAKGVEGMLHKADDARRQSIENNDRLF